MQRLVVEMGCLSTKVPPAAVTEAGHPPEAKSWSRMHCKRCLIVNIIKLLLTCGALGLLVSHLAGGHAATILPVL